MKPTITVSAAVRVPVEKAWKIWTEPKHMTHWYQASPDWHAPKATNDLRAGGLFVIRMEAKDGSAGFDLGGVYTRVIAHERIEYVLDDGRAVTVEFAPAGEGCTVTETFETESVNPVEQQRAGWQAILDSFAQYAAAA